MTHSPSATGAPSAGESICQILREDPDLDDGLALLQRPRAIEECIALTMRIPRGPWGGDVPDDLAGGIGLLVLNGLLLRRVGVNGRFGGECSGTAICLGRGRARIYSPRYPTRPPGAFWSQPVSRSSIGPPLAASRVFQS